MINNIEKFKRLYENADEEMPQNVNVEDAEDAEEDNKLTFDKFKELITNAVEDEISDDTLMIIFNVVENLIKEEAIDEGFKDIVNFFKGGTPEEIKANKEKITKKLTDIYNKYHGKKMIRFNVRGDEYSKEFVLADAFKRIAKNNYLGTIMSGERRGYIYIVYWPGNKGIDLIAGGAGAALRA